MIIKSSQRSGSKALASHLTNTRDNEKVTVSESRGLLLGNDRPVHQALMTMDGIALGSRCEKHLYHVSINPDQEMSDRDWKLAWDVYEAEFNLEEQPFIEVTHQKQGRIHKHRVYERVTAKNRAIAIAYNRMRNEKVSRILEYQLNHNITIGKHNLAVSTRLLEEGLPEVAQWMDKHQAVAVDRPVAKTQHKDEQQQKRTKITVEQVKADVEKAYHQTENGKAFKAMLEEKGYILCQGDRRDMVIVDREGGVHSPPRRLGVKVADLRKKWADLSPSNLPTVEQVKYPQQLAKTTDQRLESLQRQKKAFETAIAELEAEQDKAQLEDHRTSIEQQGEAKKAILLEQSSPLGTPDSGLKGDDKPKQDKSSLPPRNRLQERLRQQQRFIWKHLVYDQWRKIWGMGKKTDPPAFKHHDKNVKSPSSIKNANLGKALLERVKAFSYQRKAINRQEQASTKQRK
jgi:hypothetical protein